MTDPRRRLPRAQSLGAARGNGFNRDTSFPSRRKRDRAVRAMKVLAKIFIALAVAYASGLAWADDMTRYETVRIVAPQDDATVHDNLGTLEVLIEVSPPLRTDKGDHVVLLLDGKALASGAKTRFQLTEVDRGTHRLQAQVAAAGGALLLVSPETSFQMWRASLLFPSRKN